MLPSVLLRCLQSTEEILLAPDIIRYYFCDSQMRSQSNNLDMKPIQSSFYFQTQSVFKHIYPLRHTTLLHNRSIFKLNQTLNTSTLLDTIVPFSNSAQLQADLPSATTFIEHGGLDNGPNNDGRRRRHHRRQCDATHRRDSRVEEHLVIGEGIRVAALVPILCCTDRSCAITDALFD